MLVVGVDAVDKDDDDEEEEEDDDDNDDNGGDQCSGDWLQDVG